MSGMEYAIEQAAKALWDYDNSDIDPDWRDKAWNDMGGSEPFAQRIDYLGRARVLAEKGLIAPAPLRVHHSYGVIAGVGVMRSDDLAGARDLQRWATDWFPSDAVERSEVEGRES